MIMKKDIKNVLLLFSILAIGVVADHYTMYTPLVITTILYALFQIFKIMDYHAWVFDGLEDNKVMILQVWTMYIIGACWYLVSEYYGIPKSGLGI